MKFSALLLSLCMSTAWANNPAFNLAGPEAQELYEALDVTEEALVPVGLAAREKKEVSQAVDCLKLTHLSRAVSYSCDVSAKIEQAALKELYGALLVSEKNIRNAVGGSSAEKRISRLRLKKSTALISRGAIRETYELSILGQDELQDELEAMLVSNVVQVKNMMPTMAPRIQSATITFQAMSNGCTKEEHFTAKIMLLAPGRQGSLRNTSAKYGLALERIKPDLCEAVGRKKEMSVRLELPSDFDGSRLVVLNPALIEVRKVH